MVAKFTTVQKFGVRNIFCKEINALFSKGALKG